MEETLIRELVAYATAEYDKQHGIVKDATGSNRPIIAIISSETVDHDDEVISAAAMKYAMSEYMKNPVFLAAHNHKLPDGTSPVIGKIIKWWQEKDKTLCQIEFAQTDLGNQYYVLYSGGFQKAFSIGFHSLKRSTKYVGNKTVTVHEKIYVYEISAVAVGANPDALTVTKEMKDTIAKEFAAMESRIVKSLMDKIESLLVTIEAKNEEQFDRVKMLIIEKNNPNGCGGDSVGDPLIPSVEADKKTDTALIEKTIKSLIMKG